LYIVLLDYPDTQPHGIQPPSMTTKNGTQQSGSGSGPNTQPKHPDYVSERRRLQSFATCERIAVSKARLSAAGFFYCGMGDCSKCFFCSLGKKFDSVPVTKSRFIFWSDHLCRKKM